MERKQFLAKFAARRNQIRAYWKRMKRDEKRPSMAKLARQFNISRERARQIIVSTY